MAARRLTTTAVVLALLLGAGGLAVRGAGAEQFTAQIQLALRQVGIWPYDGCYVNGECPTWNAAAQTFQSGSCAGGGGSTPAADVEAGTFGAGDFVFPANLGVQTALSIGGDGADAPETRPTQGMRIARTDIHRISFLMASGIPAVRWTGSGSSMSYFTDAQAIYTADFAEFRNPSSQIMFRTGTGTDNTAAGAANLSARALDLGDQGVGTRPTCDADHRGWLWYEEAGTGVQDTLSFCVKTDADAFAWIDVIP